MQGCFPSAALNVARSRENTSRARQVPTHSAGFDARPACSHEDGDQRHFCGTCAFSDACLAEGYDKTQLGALQCLVKHEGPFSQGSYLFREGDPFVSIAAVRSGTVKTSVVDLHGREQVHGFFFPGEVIGLSAIHGDRYPCDAVALDMVSTCQFSFPQLATLASRVPRLQQRLFHLISQDIGKASLLAGDFTAIERLAGFLVSVSRRQSTNGGAVGRFPLIMTRSDIGSYLRLAPETVSRELRRLSDGGIITLERKAITIVDQPHLMTLARCILRDS
jgi:CRP/FNR family transcriptional regulator, anaerobic regulatory protein